MKKYSNNRQMDVIKMQKNDLESIERVYESTSFWHTSSPIDKDLKGNLQYLRSIGERTHFRKNEMLFKQGEYVYDLYVIEKGFVKYSLSNIDGKEKIVGYSDSFIRLDGLFHKQPILCNVTAMSDIEAICVKKDYIPNLLNRQEIVEVLLEALSRELRVLGWQIYDLCLVTNKEKVCRALYVSKIMADNSNYYAYLKHQEIADMCGIHRVTVTRLLSELQKEAIIFLEGKGPIKIIDLKNLALLGFGKIYD